MQFPVHAVVVDWQTSSYSSKKRLGKRLLHVQQVSPVYMLGSFGDSWELGDSEGKQDIRMTKKPTAALQTANCGVSRFNLIIHPTLPTDNPPASGGGCLGTASGPSLNMKKGTK